MIQFSSGLVGKLIKGDSSRNLSESRGEIALTNLGILASIFFMIIKVDPDKN